MARRDLALFLEEHEDDLLAVFREEMQRLDDELPEEAAFIDLNMVGIGDDSQSDAARTAAFPARSAGEPPALDRSAACGKRALLAAQVIISGTTQTRLFFAAGDAKEPGILCVLSDTLQVTRSGDHKSERKW